MEYRKLPRGEEPISGIGFGTSSIGMAGEKEANSWIYALKAFCFI